MNEKKTIVRITGKEAEMLTNSLFGYHIQLNKKISDFIEKELNGEMDMPEYNVSETPVPSSASFYYDRGKFNIDKKINEILSDLLELNFQ